MPLATTASRSDSAQICQRLVDRALGTGGKDNVTVMVARYGFSSTLDQTP
jgi:hypothetical protein